MQDPQPDRIWYLPHHPIENINKPGKFRRVKNAARKFRCQSLYSNLLTGPDLLNNLLGVLMRFREHPVAFLADIEGMFMQIALHQIDQSALRFLWLADNQIQQYQFTGFISPLEQIARFRAQYTFLTIVPKITVNNSQNPSKPSESTFTWMTTSNHMKQKKTLVRQFLKQNIVCKQVGFKSQSLFQTAL